MSQEFGRKRLDKSSFFQHVEGAVLAHGAEGPGGKAEFHIGIQFGNPDAFVTQVGREGAVYLLDVIKADTAFFLGFTTVVNAAATEGLGSGDDTDSGHKAWFFWKIEKAGKGPSL